ncbi:MAG: flagellar basal body-associated FliL family protein [Spirochaetales bacterium]|nr:flagellar basal body-associated FliL family protein [Spirochaetales bacterium]MBP7262718.1 flagellar basal body-associated FliL family protein [Spirochaetia bacterium]
MSDDFDKGGPDFTDGQDIVEKPKRKGGSTAILGMLKWVGIGLGAVIFIVVIVVITNGVINQQAKPLSSVPASESYQAVLPIYATFTTLDQISTQTTDKEPWAIVVKINLGYEEDDKQVADELNQRRYQIQDDLRNFFSVRTISQLAPNNEDLLKEEIRARLNRILTKPAIKAVYFQDFKRTQM